MTVKALAITMVVGAAAGAVGILMMSRSNPTRRLATQAAIIFCPSPLYTQHWVLLQNIAPPRDSGLHQATEFPSHNVAV